MAEIRKFDPSSGEGIQRQVRDLLGENIRPFQPGEAIVSAHADDPDPEPEYLVEVADAVRIDFDWSAAGE